MSHETRDPIPHVDKLLLIQLINERPALWDETANSNRSSVLRKAAWQEVCRLLKNDYSKLNATEKQKYYQAILKIWRHIKVTWKRSLKARANGKIKGVFVKPYKYHDEMLFLRKLPKASERRRQRRIAESSDTEEEEESEEKEIETIEESEEDSNTVIKIESIEPDIDIKEEVIAPVSNQETNTDIHVPLEKHDNFFVPDDVIDAKIKAYINDRLKEMKNPHETPQDDRHLAFFKSLMPTLVLLNDDQILEYQASVINVLRDIKSRESIDFNDKPSSSSNYVFNQKLEKE